MTAPPEPQGGGRAESMGDSSAAQGSASAQRTVLKNTLLLAIGQVLSLPLSMLLTAVTARYLGPKPLGEMYLGTSLNSLGALLTEWGQGGALPALVAKDDVVAGRLLGTSLAWRGAASCVVFVALNVAAVVLGYDAETRTVINIVFLGYTFGAIVNACQLILIGFERQDVAARRQVLEPLLSLLVVVPILILGGQLVPVLWGHLAVAGVVCVYVWRFLRQTPVGNLSFDWSTLKTVLRAGTPFVFLIVAMIVQPNIDSMFLSKLSTDESIGWLAAARKLLGVLLLPASALIGGAYPTLCRLHTSDTKAFAETTSATLRATTVLALPAALCCALYADVGISIYSRASFAAAEDDLRVSSVFVLLVYFTMPIGTALTASGKQRSWAVVQAVSSLTSLVLDPFLIPIFQRRNGNGGLGVCVATVMSELVVLGGGLVLAPRGVLDRKLARAVGLAIAAGCVMALVSVALRRISIFLAAPAALAAYGSTIWLTGGIEREWVEGISNFLSRKLARLRRARP